MPNITNIKVMCIPGVVKLYTLKRHIKFQKLDKRQHGQNVKDYFSININVLFLNKPIVL